MSTPPSPFKLVSAALFQARDSLQGTTYDKWRTLLKRFENYRGGIDPMADQNANLDVLLRSMEGNVEQELTRHGNLAHETAGFQLHLHLSRLWGQANSRAFYAIHHRFPGGRWQGNLGLLV